MNVLNTIVSLLAGDREADRIVPPSGHTVHLTVFASAAMTFLAVFALALSLATGRLADRWSDGLARTSTVRILAPSDQEAAQVRAALRVLETTPGVGSARALSVEEQRALLEPWFGPDLPVETLPIPRLIEVIEAGDGYDGEGLRQRLAAEVPAAILDDHTRWRRPLIAASDRLRMLGTASLALILATTGAVITLAAQASLSANGRVIQVMRLIGARDTYIARAFVRRIAIRAFLGAIIGAFLGLVAVALLPPAATAGGFLTGLGFQGFEWLLPLVLPPICAVIAFFATRRAALRYLRALP